MTKEATTDATTDIVDGRTRQDIEAEGKLKAQLEEVNKKIEELKTAKDAQADELTKKYQADKSKLESDIATKAEETAKLKAEIEARNAEDKAEFDSILAELTESKEPNAKQKIGLIEALPESMTTREKLAYIKKNKQIFMPSNPIGFGQPSKPDDQSGTGEYIPTPIDNLIKGGKAAIMAERERLNKSFGG